MKNILIVEDSETEAMMLKKIFESAGDLKVVACAKNGKEAVFFTEKYHPDVITMDINMPIMDGLEATNIIMSQHPTPIVVISSTLNDKEMQTTFNALQAGALTVLEKPIDFSSPKFSLAKKYMIDTVRNMADIRVIKRRFSVNKSVKKLNYHLPSTRNGYELIAIGTSVGGPQALIKILSGLPKTFPLPIMIVQHMTQGFINGFVNWLDKNTELNVKVAEHGEVLKPGFVYFAPDNIHLQVSRMNEKLVAILIQGDPVSGFRPSATVLLKSVGMSCGKSAIGILLTGMGSDGADGLLHLKNAKGHTLIQDSKSAVVFGMAGVAQTLGAVDVVVELNEISDYLNKIVTKNI